MYIYGLVYIIDAYELSCVSISSIVQRDSNEIMRKIESYVSMHSQYSRLYQCKTSNKYTSFKNNTQPCAIYNDNAVFFSMQEFFWLRTKDF